MIELGEIAEPVEGAVPLLEVEDAGELQEWFTHEDAPTRPALQGETRVGAWESTEGKITMSESTVACENCAMTVEYMGPAEVAAYVGLTAGTIRYYAANGRMPDPDVRIGPNGGWSKETIDVWMANRPGQGARTDLAVSKGTK